MRISLSRTRGNLVFAFTWPSLVLLLYECIWFVACWLWRESVHVTRTMGIWGDLWRIFLMGLLLIVVAYLAYVTWAVFRFLWHLRSSGLEPVDKKTRYSLEYFEEELPYSEKSVSNPSWFGRIRGKGWASPEDQRGTDQIPERSPSRIRVGLGIIAAICLLLFIAGALFCMVLVGLRDIPVMIAKGRVPEAFILLLLYLMAGGTMTLLLVSLRFRRGCVRE